MNHSAPGQQVGSGRGLLQRACFRAVAAAAAGGLLLASAGALHADTVTNTVDATVDATVEVLALNVGMNGTTTLQLDSRSVPQGDTEPGCNVKKGHTLTLNLASSDPAVATISPSIVVFDTCGTQGAKTLTISPLKTGSTTVTAAVNVSTTAAGTFDLAPATFRVDVAPPSNTAPVLAVQGAEPGHPYAKGDVPFTTCTVNDQEDGPSSSPATLSIITGPHALDGIGEQTANCSYTDGGGLYVASSVTYNIVDPTAPLISYTLDPANPDGTNHWYINQVQLTWHVSELESPNSLSRNGCVDQLIAEDQLAASYPCSATSAGGSADEQTVTLMKDGTVPTVNLDGENTAAANAHNWYKADVLAKFIASDATSGLATSVATGQVLSSGEGADVPVQSMVFGDMAGNTSSGTAYFNIDKTEPVVTYDAAATAAANGDPNENGWYTADVLARFNGSDALSGLLTAPATQETPSIGEGSAVEVTSPVYQDKAGNTSTTTATFKIDKTKPSVGFTSDVSGSYYFGSVPAAPACEASDATSGLAGDCRVSGYSTAVGTHTVTATAADLAGNTGTAAQTYTVNPWNTKGFYQPIDMGGVLNTVKGGSTVPAKFEVFVGETELTDTSQVTVAAKAIPCALDAGTAAIETTVAGASSLRYDATAGQFTYNWKTPVGAGKCYELTMTAADGTAIRANFKMK